MTPRAHGSATGAGTFGIDWLRLREPHDHRARATAAAALLGDGWAAGLVTGRDNGSAASPPALRVMDLGCGTGATLRQLAPRLAGRQHWRVYDHDAHLLRAWPDAMAEWSRSTAGVRVHDAGLHIEGAGFAATVEQHILDLALAPHALAALPLADTDLLAATALIDLVSAAWLADLIERASRHRVAVVFGLVVDGRIEWQPALEGDGHVAAAFGAHQGRDKGFGAALGAHAPETARRLLARAGYGVEEARSDWRLQGAAADDAKLLAAFIDGMASAAAEHTPAQAATVEGWRRRRADALERTQLRVGHVDLVATPRRAA